MTNTGTNQTVFITPDATTGTPLSSGDQIGVFYISSTGEAISAGFSFWNGGQLQITAFGDDATTDDIDGLLVGAPLLLIAQSGDNVYIVTASYLAPNMSTYVTNGISFITDLDFELACTVEYLGCTDPSACNYDPTANTNDNSCFYPGDIYNCEGGCVNDSDDDLVCDEFEVVGCQDPTASNYDSNATDLGTCISWQDAYEACVESSGDNGIGQEDADIAYLIGYADGVASVTPEDGIGQADVDAAYADGVASVTPEDGIGQADVDAAYADGVASVTPEDGIGQADVDAAYADGVASVTPEDGIGQADVDAAYADGVASVTPEDGIGQADVDAAYADGVASVTPEDGIGQADVDAAYADGVASVTPEDGIGQADVDAAYADGVASVTPEDGIGQADVDAAYADGVASVTPEDGIGQADVDAAYADGVASVTPEDGIGQADVDAAYADGVASVTPEDGIGQADVDESYLYGYNDGLASAQADLDALQVLLDEAIANSGNGSCEPIYIDLIEGWNMIGYTKREPQDAVATFQEITDIIFIVKNNSADVYIGQNMDLMELVI